MAEIEEPTGKPTDLRRDQNMDAEVQVDASLYRLAAAFGTVAFPPGMPDFQKNAILEKAEQDRNAEGSLLADSTANPDDRRRENKRETDSNMSQWADLVQQEREERDQWARTSSTVGGVTKTGAGWQAFADHLREDDELHQRIIEAFRKRGMTEEEAEERYERVIDIAEIAAMPPSQRTEEQQQQFEKAQADPTFQRDMSEANALHDIYAKPKADAGASVEASTTDAQATPQTEPKPSVAMVNGPGF